MLLLLLLLEDCPFDDQLMQGLVGIPAQGEMLQQQKQKDVLLLLLASASPSFCSWIQNEGLILDTGYAM